MDDPIIAARQNRKMLLERAKDRAKIAKEMAHMAHYSPPAHGPGERSYVSPEEAVAALGMMENHRKIATDLVYRMTEGMPVLQVAREARDAGIDRYDIREMIKRTHRIIEEHRNQQRPILGPSNNGPIKKSFSPLDLVKADRPPAGFAPAPKSTKGGYRARKGNSWLYWYPDGKGVRGVPHSEDHKDVHEAHKTAPKSGKPSKEVHDRFMLVEEKARDAGIRLTSHPTASHTIKDIEKLDSDLDRLIKKRTQEPKNMSPPTGETTEASGEMGDNSELSPESPPEKPMSKAELYEIASAMQINGRSRMTKSKLKAAIEQRQAKQHSELGEVLETLDTAGVDTTDLRSAHKRSMTKESLRFRHVALRSLRYLLTGALMGILSGSAQGALMGAARGAQNAALYQAHILDAHRALRAELASSPPKREEVSKAGLLLDINTGRVFLGSDRLQKADSYKVPAGARGNARKVLEWKRKHGSEVKGMTPVGWARARQLASQATIGMDTVKRMSAFNRHRKNSAIAPEHKDTPWKDAGYVAWLGWGGTTGVDWARRITGALNKATIPELSLAKAGPFIGPRGGKWADAKHTIPWGYKGEIGGRGHVKALSEHVSAHHKVKLSLSHRDGKTTLHKVVVPKSERGKGTGDAVMAALNRHADEHGHTIALTPEPLHGEGGSKAKLKKWYKRHGFVDNKGRNKDYEVSETMLRPPQSLAKSAGPFIGPKGGKWADAKHTIPWKEDAHPHAGMTHTVYRDQSSKKKQPPGRIGDPKLGKLLGWEGGKVTMPATGGVHDTPLSHLDGVPVQTLDKENTRSIVSAKREGTALPPIDLEVTAAGRVHLIDGHHRLDAARASGDSSIRVNWIFRKSEGFSKAGPFIGPKGGKWADAKHTIHWDEDKHGKRAKAAKEKTKPANKAPGSQLPPAVLAKLKALECSKLPDAKIPLSEIAVGDMDGPKQHTHALIKFRDGNGEIQSGYSAEFHRRSDAAKWSMVEQHASNLKKYQRKTVTALAKSEPGSIQHQAALVVSVIAKTGLRPGSEKSLKGHGRYGVTTIMADQVKIRGSKVEIEYVGKAGKKNTATINSKAVAEAFQGYIDQSNGGRLFAPASLRAAAKEAKSAYGLKLKDFRTLVGTERAEKALKSRTEPPPPLTGNANKDRKLLQRALKEASSIVAQHLNNTPAVARSSYIHPGVFDKWALGTVRANPDLWERSK